jgi:hypothetical protein
MDLVLRKGETVNISYATGSIMLWLTLAAVALANGTQIALHEGSNDPETEGWTRERSFSNVDTFPISNDLGSGIDAWAVYDNGFSDGYYQYNLTPEQGALASTFGWKLTTTIRVVDFVELSPTDSATKVGFGSYDLKFGALSDGTPQVSVYGISDILTLNGLDSGYHLYELVFDPSENNADLFVNGYLQASDLISTTTASPANVMFGSTVGNGEGGVGATGRANYSLVNLQAVPEPNSIVLVIAGLLAAAGAGSWRH